MSLVISPSVNQYIDLLAAAASSIDTEIGTFTHSPFIRSNLINTFENTSHFENMKWEMDL